jgi:hypothetical protein
MGEERSDRVFVTIIARDARHLREVFRFDLDLFEGGAEAKEHTIQGLITLDDVGRLVESGYRVSVNDTDRPKHEHRFVEFEEWRDDLFADLKRDQKGV